MMNSKEKKYENMTPLEALEWIDAYSEDDVYHNITNEVNIIKKALSRIEQLEKENQELKEEKDFAWEKSRENWVKYQKECEDVSELLLCIEKKNEELVRYEKALDLIKDYLTIANDVPLMTFAERCFTEEEVKLLKDILDCE